MGSTFRKNVATTGVFFIVRFLFSFALSVLYIFIAAIIQYYFVLLMGESTFNYIVGGLLSLLLGVLFCRGVGSLCFMLVKGWHVAALAYASKIRKTGAPAFSVGVKAFRKNLVSFGAVYGVRLIIRELTKGLKDSLWELMGDAPYASVLKRFATHPIVEYLTSDILHYAFDATVYYLVRFPPEGLDDAPGVVMTALKKYVICIPSILLTSVQTYICLRFVPKVLKWVAIIWVIWSQGLVAGILINVLMFPLFYILDNALFDPLTMVAFLSTYSKKCKEDIDDGNPIAAVIDRIMSGEDTSAESERKESKESRPSKPRAAQREANSPSNRIAVSGADFVDIDEDQEKPAPATPTPAVEKRAEAPSPSSQAALSAAQSLQALVALANTAMDEDDDDDGDLFRLGTHTPNVDLELDEDDAEGAIGAASEGQSEERSRSFMSQASFLRGLGSSFAGADLHRAGYLSGDEDDESGSGDAPIDPFA